MTFLTTNTYVSSILKYEMEDRIWRVFQKINLFNLPNTLGRSIGQKSMKISILFFCKKSLNMFVGQVQNYYRASATVKYPKIVPKGGETST